MKQKGDKSLKIDRFSTKQFLTWAFLASLGYGLLAYGPPFARPIGLFLIFFCSFTAGGEEWIRPIPARELVKMLGGAVLLGLVLVGAKFLTPEVAQLLPAAIVRWIDSIPWRPLLLTPVWFTYIWSGFRSWRKGRCLAMPAR